MRECEAIEVADSRLAGRAAKPAALPAHVPAAVLPAATAAGVAAVVPAFASEGVPAAAREPPLPAATSARGSRERFVSYHASAWVLEKWCREKRMRLSFFTPASITNVRNTPCA